jgi:bacterioferritin
VPEAEAQGASSFVSGLLDEFSVISVRGGPIYRIAPSGELDIATCETLECALEDAERTTVRVIELALGGLVFIDSAGIHLLMDARARSQANGREFRLTNGPPGVRRLLRLLGLDQILPFVADGSRPLGRVDYESAPTGIQPSDRPSRSRPRPDTGDEMATKESHSVLDEEQREQREKLVGMLTKAYWMEIETVMNYLASSVNPDGVRAQEIIRSLAADVTEELGHAQQFADRIKELYGVVPGSADFTAEQAYLQPPAHQTDVAHIIKGVIEAETGAIDFYNEIVDFTEEFDPVTNDMVIAILHDEEGHRRLFEGFLREYRADGLAD